MRAWGILAAAGQGVRLRAGFPKAYALLFGKEMFLRPLERMLISPSIDGIVVVVPAGWEDATRELVEDKTLGKPVVVIAGGDSRQSSVREALSRIPSGVDAVVVHDAARPNPSTRSFDDVLEALTGADGAIAAVQVFDTLKRVGEGNIIETVLREGLWRAQTPQAFRLDVLRGAHENAAREGFEATDDAQLLERIGARVVVVEGDERNSKVTTQADLQRVADEWLATHGVWAGVGYDAHAFAEGRPLMLGGVQIPYDRGLAGHSDGDVLSHAIADAVLGAVHLGDIGEHFPSDSSEFAGISGAQILRHVARLIRERGMGILRIDATVVVQEPTLAPYRKTMETEIAEALGGAAVVGVKATTTDRLGVTGRGEGAAAYAIAVIGLLGDPARIPGYSLVQPSEDMT